MKFITLLLLVSIGFSCSEIEVEASLSRDQFRTLLANETNKSWEVKSTGMDDFMTCEDNMIYIFSRNSTDTGNLYITAPLLDCNEMLVDELDTLSELRWTLTQSESSIFDNQLFIINNDVSEQFQVIRINPLQLILNPLENDLVISLDSLFIE